MWDLAAKCWASLGTAWSSWSSQHCILGLVGQIFVVLLAQEQSCANKHSSGRCLHVSWQGRMSPIPGCQASTQFMSSLCTPAWVQSRARGALHHSQPAESCRTGVQNQLSSSPDRWTDTLGEGVRDSR